MEGRWRPPNVEPLRQTNRSNSDRMRQWLCNGSPSADGCFSLVGFRFVFLSVTWYGITGLETVASSSYLYGLFCVCVCVCVCVCLFARVFACVFNNQNPKPAFRVESFCGRVSDAPLSELVFAFRLLPGLCRCFFCCLDRGDVALRSFFKCSFFSARR